MTQITTGVIITQLQPDILECEVKWALGSITTNKASGGDGIPVAFLALDGQKFARVSVSFGLLGTGLMFLVPKMLTHITHHYINQ